MLEECLECLEARTKSSESLKYEIIVVSDGSKDKTVQKSLEYSKKLGTDKFRVLELIKNRGKGGAVRLVIFFFNPQIQILLKSLSFNWAGNAKLTRSIPSFCWRWWCLKVFRLSKTRTKYPETRPKLGHRCNFNRFESSSWRRIQGEEKFLPNYFDARISRLSLVFCR